MSTATIKTPTRIIKLRVISPTTKKTVGYECLTLSTNGTARQFSLDGESWESGLFEGNDYIRDEWSGVQDQHGTDIYENDIVVYAGHANRVQFKQGMFGYLAAKGVFNPAGKYMFQLYSKQEVIGNVHQSPELLDGTGNTIKWQPKGGEGRA